LYYSEYYSSFNKETKLRKNQSIRSDLVAHKEQQAGFQRRLKREAFGIYRPLTDESYQELHNILSGAKEEIDDFLGKRRKISADVILPDQMGITFVGLQNTRRAMRHKRILQRGFDIKLLQQSVDNYNEEITAPLEVPIDELDWYSMHNRRLVGKLAVSHAMDEIIDNSESIDSLLQQARGDQLRVLQPDHVSLFKYGRSRDNLDLSRRHRLDVANIVNDHLGFADLGSVMLDKIIIGKTYTQPISVT